MTEERNLLLFYHRNPEQTVFDIAVAQQGMENVESQMMNPLKDLTFGGYLLEIIWNLRIQQTVSMPVQITVLGTSTLQRLLGKNNFASFCTQTRRKRSINGNKA